jgi:DNA-binding NarL/FixJ family response regulator
MKRLQPEEQARIAAETQSKIKPAEIDRIRVLIVDDHAIMRRGLTALLSNVPDMEIAGEAADGEASISLVRELCPDVVLMDISMPGMSGIEATRIIHSELPDVRVIGLSMFQEGGLGEAMRKAGAVEYLTKGVPAEILISAIRRCGQNRSLCARP